MLAYCGIRCDNCPAYRGTVEADVSLLEEAAARFHPGSAAEDWVCLGCLPADQAFLAQDCARCPIRPCAGRRGVQNCAACADFEGCEHMQEFLAHSDEAAQRIELLRQRYLAG